MITQEGRLAIASAMAGVTSMTLTGFSIEIGSGTTAENEMQADLVTLVAATAAGGVTLKRMSYLATDDTIQFTGEIYMAAAGTVEEVGLRDSNGKLLVRKLYHKPYIAKDNLIITISITSKYGFYTG